MEAIRFAKMSGAGNDFIVIDNRDNTIELDEAVIEKVCSRGLAIGADGLLVLTLCEQADFKMVYYNADGSRAEMCGNGARCIARFAVLIGLCQEKKQLTFETDAGMYQAVVEGMFVELKMIPPTGLKQDIKLALKDGERLCDFLNTGVPHAVFFTEALAEENVNELGREVRYHEHFQPKGTNVNFCQPIDQHTIAFRIYERGVENETLASGTGAAACVLTAASRQLVQSPVTVKTHSGIVLEMQFEQDQDGFSNVVQKGEARLIYWGELSKEALAFGDAN